MTAVKDFLRSKAAIGVGAAIVLVGGYLFFTRDTAPAQFVTVTRGALTETVSLTGNTAPIEDVTLGFQTTGTIALVYKKLGEKVRAGQTIAALNAAALSAALAQAQGKLAAELASRSSTSLPEAATQARNTYLSAHTTLDTELENNVDTFFGSPTAYGPTLLINAPMYSYGELSKERDALDDQMRAYQKALSGAGEQDPLMLLESATAAAKSVSLFLDKLAVAVNDAGSSATSAQITALATARSKVTALLATLSTARDTYRLASVGATSLADATVEQAKAAVDAARANLANAYLVAPISGVITKQDAKVGELATAGAPLVSILSNAGFEVDADISETDIGKVSVSDTATMTIDAFPNETFAGKVFYIAPAETNTEGVVSYEIKISFDTPDPRLKSGLTANIDIATDHKEDVLLLPQYAILQNDEGTFVQVVEGGTLVTRPVTLGIQDQEGNVEVLSGVTEGERVINIGRKSQ